MSARRSTSVLLSLLRKNIAQGENANTKITIDNIIQNKDINKLQSCLVYSFLANINKHSISATTFERLDNLITNKNILEGSSITVLSLRLRCLLKFKLSHEVCALQLYEEMLLTDNYSQNQIFNFLFLLSIPGKESKQFFTLTKEIMRVLEDKLDKIDQTNYNLLVDMKIFLGKSFYEFPQTYKDKLEDKIDKYLNYFTYAETNSLVSCYGPKSAKLIFKVLKYQNIHTKKRFLAQLFLFKINQTISNFEWLPGKMIQCQQDVQPLLQFTEMVGNLVKYIEIFPFKTVPSYLPQGALSVQDPLFLESNMFLDRYVLHVYNYISRSHRLGLTSSVNFLRVFMHIIEPTSFQSFEKERFDALAFGNFNNPVYWAKINTLKLYIVLDHIRLYESKVQGSKEILLKLLKRVNDVNVSKYLEKMNYQKEFNFMEGQLLLNFLYNELMNWIQRKKSIQSEQTLILLPRIKSILNFYKQRENVSDELSKLKRMLTFVQSYENKPFKHIDYLQEYNYLDSSSQFHGNWSQWKEDTQFYQSLKEKIAFKKIRLFKNVELSSSVFFSYLIFQDDLIRFAIDRKNLKNVYVCQSQNQENVSLCSALLWKQRFCSLVFNAQYYVARNDQEEAQFFYKSFKRICQKKE